MRDVHPDVAIVGDEREALSALSTRLHHRGRFDEPGPCGQLPLRRVAHQPKVKLFSDWIVRDRDTVSAVG
jgi:hypothetical protein